MKTLIDNPEAPKPYEPIETSLTESDITTVMNSFLAFLELPYEERVKIQYVDETRPRTGWSGYAHDRAETAEEEQDNKHKFHMTQELHRAFAIERDSRAYPALPTETRQFLSLAYEAHVQLADAAKVKYGELEDDIPGITLMHFPRGGEIASHTRFLAYEPGSSLLAEPHYDKSTGTIAVAESHDGLRLGFGEEDLTLVDRHRFDPLFFPGYGYHQLAEMMDVDVHRRAGWHDVVDTGKRVNDQIARWALIHFINPARIYLASTKEQTHTPIPWRNAGKIALRRDNGSFLTQPLAA